MKGERWANGGAVIAAIAASLCCVGPALFAALGFGAFGAAAVFESLRPFLLAGAVLLLAFGFYRAYFRRRRAVCASGEACDAKPVIRMGHAGLWITALAVLAFALAPYYVGHIAAALARRQPPVTTTTPAAPAAEQASSGSNLETVTVRVEGMDCASCEVPIKAALGRLPGVREAVVSYGRGDARVEYDPRRTNVEQIRRAIDATGYKAR